MRVLEVLERAPADFARREEFESQLAAEGLEPSLVAWLAMNVRPTPEGRFHFRLDLPSIRALLGDYFAHDLWGPIESPPGRVQWRLVIGGRSTVFDEADRARAERAAAANPARVEVHVLPSAGHWVHVDDPAGLHRLLVERTP